MPRKLLAMTVAALLAALPGCYNTYNVSLEEMGKLQEGGQSSAVTVATAEGENVVVTEDTKIGVTDSSGAYHAISPFNFTMIAGQLVAPDEDLLLSTSNIETGNVKMVSGTKTALLVAAGLVAVAGAGLYITLTAPEKKGFGQQ